RLALRDAAPVPACRRPPRKWVWIVIVHLLSTKSDTDRRRPIAADQARTRSQRQSLVIFRSELSNGYDPAGPGQSHPVPPRQDRAIRANDRAALRTTNLVLSRT